MDYSACYDPDTDFDRWYTEATGDAIAAFVRPGDRILELGCATGAMTARLVAAGATVVGVDRSPTYLARARARQLDRATFVQGDIASVPHDIGADPSSAAPFDHVVVANVLHEVDDPASVVRVARTAVASHGLLHVSLQNPRSIHRLVALEIGAISSLTAVSARGEEYGTRRLLEREELVDLVACGGWSLLHATGLVLKPLPNALMAELDEAVLRGFVRAATYAPDLAAMMYLAFRAA